jgi:hypothetical protein
MKKRKGKGKCSREHPLFKKLIILSTLATTGWQLPQVINYLLVEIYHAFDK